jgi:hypothetical protein
MTSQEQKPVEADLSRPALSPTVWEKMRERVQEIAQQIAQSVQHVIVDEERCEKKAESPPS